MSDPIQTGKTRRHVVMANAPKPAVSVRKTVAVCLMLALAGCADIGSKDTEYRDLADSRVREIRVARFDEQSLSAPVSVEEASERLAKELAQPKPTTQAAELGIQQVRAAVLAGNLNLKVQLVTPSIAGETLNAEKAKFEPLFTGAVEYADSHDQDDLNSVLTDVQTGIRFPLWTGGAFSTEIPVGFADTDGEDDQRSAALDFSFSQPLLRNAGVRANMYSIRIAGYGKRIADVQANLAVTAFLAGADREYWLLYAATRALDVAEQQYRLAMQQLDLARKMVAAGAAPRIEITRAESGLAGRLESIIITKTAVRIRERELKRMMNRGDMPIDSDASIKPVTEPNPMGYELDGNELVKRALADRMELVALELQSAADAASVEFRRNGALPRVDLFVHSTLGGAAADVEDAFGNIADKGFSHLSAGAVAEIPIGNRSARAELRQAMDRRFQTGLSREAMQLAIRQDVYDALDQLNRDWQRILANRQGTIVAAQNYQAEQRQFELGLRTSIEVLDAATRLAEAQLREIEALAEYEISKVNLAVATGALIGQDQVCWEPLVPSGGSSENPKQ